jgi:hypothetical protein
MDVGAVDAPTIRRSHSPTQGTAEENKATAQGTITYFGRRIAPLPFILTVVRSRIGTGPTRSAFLQSRETSSS